MPISINHAYYFQRLGKRTVKIKTKECKEYVKYIKSTCKGCKKYDDKIQVRIQLYYKDNRRRDIDNAQKILLDSLTGILWGDDSQIFFLQTEKSLGQKEEKTVVTVTEVLA